MWILIVVLALILLILGAAYATFFIAFYSNPKKTGEILGAPPGDVYKPHYERFGQLINEFKEIPFEGVYIKAKDGTKLFARYYHVNDGAPLQIQCHGYRGSGYRDFCGGNKIAREMGHNTLLIDQRACGNSGGRAITFGIKERQDLLCWINYAVERFGSEVRIFLCGVSMGGSTVIMVSDMDLPKNVVGIVADCPFSDPKEIIAKVSDDLKIPSKLSMPFIRLGARIYGGFNLNEASAINSIKNAKVPILLIHGEEDGFVPCAMSDALASAAKGKVIYEKFPLANHGISYIIDTDRYQKATKSFIDSCINI